MSSGDTKACTYNLRINATVPAEAMIHFDGPHRLSLDGEPYIVSFRGNDFKLKGNRNAEMTADVVEQTSGIELEVTP